MPWHWPSATQLNPSWRALWQQFESSDVGQGLRAWLEARAAAGADIVPAHPLHALELTAMKDVRVVILGQDPYHGEGQAHGLAFSVPQGVKLPPSLRNIFSEIKREFGRAPGPSGNLESWARQGALLLNTVLTVELGQPAAHAQRGWETFTRSVVQRVAQDPTPKVFLLWGAFAQKFKDLITEAGAQHCVLSANHPSPLSARRPPAPFLGCGHFSKANGFLQAQGRSAIDWA